MDQLMNTLTKGAFLVRDNRVFNGPLRRLLRSFARTTHSIRSATLVLLARSIQGLAHSLHSLPCGTFEILEYLFTLLSRFTGTNAFFIFTRNTPRDKKKTANDEKTRLTGSTPFTRKRKRTKETRIGE